MQERRVAQPPYSSSDFCRISMIGVVVVTHGQLATELVNAAEMIVGDLPQFAAVVDRLARRCRDDAREEIGQAIERRAERMPAC